MEFQTISFQFWHLKMLTRIFIILSIISIKSAFANESHTDTFTQAVKREFVEKKTISEDDLIHFILNLDEEVVRNPIAEHKKASGLKFTLAYKQFQRLIQKHEDAINWEAVREFANNLLEEGRRVEVDKKVVRKNTEFLMETNKRKTVATGKYHSCAIQKNREVRCWGDDTSDMNVPNDLEPVIDIAAGESNTCVLQISRKVRCWGKNRCGETNVPPNLTDVNSIFSGSNHFCAIHHNTKLSCWGLNEDNQTDVPPNLPPIASVDCGMSHTCALKIEGGVICWGYSHNGGIALPANLPPLIAIGLSHVQSCGLLRNKRVLCWKNNGELHTDVPGDLPQVTNIAVGLFHKCALDNNSGVRCWGGDNRYREINVPDDLLPIISINSGYFHTCAIQINGALKCWGYNGLGQINIPEGLEVMLPSEIEEKDDDSTL